MKLFVWDFHGVLERNNEFAVMEVTNRVLVEYGSDITLTPKLCHEYYGLKWFEYFQRLDPKLDLPTCLQLQERCFEISNREPEIVAKHIKRTKGAKKVLSEIKSNHRQILISNTDPVAIKLFIKAVGVEVFFDESNTFPVNSHRDSTKTKKDVLSEYLKIQKDNFEEIIAIGDSPGDVELATLFPKSKSYLYTHPGKNHKECYADYKINNLLEILKEI